jgi:hypothetical protein
MKSPRTHAFTRRVVAPAALALSLVTAPAQAASPLPTQAPSGPARPYEVMRKGVEVNNYLGPLLELKSKEAQYLSSERMRESYLEYVTLLHSFVGDFGEAYAYEDKLLSTFPDVARMRGLYAKELTTSPIDGYRPRDAVEAIASAAAARQVVMINEEHRTPVHRALTLRLLPALYAKGFRYFAAETLDEGDAELNRRGYPTQKTGFYTADPVYADVIRTALKLGYKVVPYEHMKDCEPRADNPMSCQDERERGQAQNLADRILKHDPRAKIFVHVGRSHNAKVSNEGQFAFMGWHFREMTGIDPFVIDQVRMSERRSPADEHPLYRYATRKGWVKEPTVFESAAGELWTDDKDTADVRVFTPKAQYVDGRPTWLRMGGMRAPRGVAPGRLGLRARRGRFDGREPVLVQAFFTKEGADAVPVDQVVFYPSREMPVLMLPTGAFRVRAINAAGSALGEYRMTVR